ncbi:23638_t:CDS:2, partial [Gigaspora margarita]
PIYEADFNIVVLVERSEGASIQIKGRAKLDVLNLPEFIYVNMSSIIETACVLNWNQKVGGNWQSFSRVRTYSLTIAVWKFYYILDLLEDNCQPMDLKEGFNIIWDIVKDGFKISTTNNNLTI